MSMKTVLPLCILITSVFATQELKLVHVIFAHKLYAPITDMLKDNKINFPRNLTYEYFHARSVDISNTGKLNLYDLGIYLRKRYDMFLGDIYMPELAKTRTTEFPLSIIAAQLVNAGLWPPRGIQKWTDEMEWQPIPSDYEPLRNDRLFLGTLCPNFKLEVQNVLQLEKMRNKITYHEPLFNHISTHTGINVSLPSDVALIYSGLEMLVDQGITVPTWADGIFPDGEMYNVTLLEYDILSETLFQRQLNGGVMLKEILANSIYYMDGSLSNERKMMLYSGDQINLVAIFKNLNLWSTPHIPEEASTLIFEMHFDNDTRVYGIKIIYYTGIDMETIPLIIPDCEEICPIDKFTDIIVRMIPSSEEILCGWETSFPINDEFNSDNQNIQNSSPCSRISIVSFIIAVIITRYITQ